MSVVIEERQKEESLTTSVGHTGCFKDEMARSLYSCIDQLLVMAGLAVGVTLGKATLVS